MQSVKKARSAWFKMAISSLFWLGLVAISATLATALAILSSVG